MSEKKTGECIWLQDDDGAYDTSCEQRHLFIVGNCYENEYLYCPYCGKQIAEREKE